MSKPNRPETGGPAFPRPASIDPTSGDLFDGNRVVPEHDGMTLRDYFAGLAMQGLLAGMFDNEVRDNFLDMGNADTRQWLAARSYAVADAMLAARKNPAR